MTSYSSHLIATAAQSETADKLAKLKDSSDIWRYRILYIEDDPDLKDTIKWICHWNRIEKGIIKQTKVTIRIYPDGTASLYNWQTKKKMPLIVTGEVADKGHSRIETIISQLKVLMDKDPAFRKRVFEKKNGSVFYPTASKIYSDADFRRIPDPDGGWGAIFKLTKKDAKEVAEWIKEKALKYL